MAALGDLDRLDPDTALHIFDIAFDDRQTDAQPRHRTILVVQTFERLKRHTRLIGREPLPLIHDGQTHHVVLNRAKDPHTATTGAIAHSIVQQIAQRHFQTHRIGHNQDIVGQIGHHHHALLGRADPHPVDQTLHHHPHIHRAARGAQGAIADLAKGQRAVHHVQHIIGRHMDAPRLPHTGVKPRLARLHLQQLCRADHCGQGRAHVVADGTQEHRFRLTGGFGPRHRRLKRRRIARHETREKTDLEHHHPKGRAMGHIGQDMGLL